MYAIDGEVELLDLDVMLEDDDLSAELLELASLEDPGPFCQDD